jgi:hypothetical protein
MASRNKLVMNGVEYDVFAKQLKQTLEQPQRRSVKSRTPTFQPTKMLRDAQICSAASV